VAFSVALVFRLAPRACACLLLNPLAAICQTQSFPQALTPDQTEAKSAWNAAKAAFMGSDFDKAYRLSQRARELDPSSPNPSLYLAQNYILDALLTEEKQQKEEAPEPAFLALLLFGVESMDPNSYQATEGHPLDSEAFEDYKTYQRKLMQVTPQDPQPYYAIGIMEWAFAFQADEQIRSNFNSSIRERGGKPLDDKDPLPEALRNDYAHGYGSLINEGISSLKQALQFNPEYRDAMIYLNLLYRCKADTESDASARDEDFKKADVLVGKLNQNRTNQTRPD